MNAVAVPRLWGEKRDVPQFLDGETTGLLSVGRRLLDNPSTVELADGRTLGYAETGAPDGDPVLAFHGIPNGRLGAAVFDQVGRDLGIRILALERPGVGVSDPAPERELLDWSTDVTQFLDALGLDAVLVLGISGGGPYALACGVVAPDRFPRVATCCGVGPVESASPAVRLLLRSANYFPWLPRTFLGLEVRSAEYAPEWTIDRRVRGSAPEDETVWRGEVGQLLVASIPVACRHHGTAPFVRDLQLFGRDWEFSLADIDVPVGIWHGEADRINPVGMARYLRDAIPTAEAFLYPDRGHVSIFVEHDREMFGWLTQYVGRSTAHESERRRARMPAVPEPLPPCP